MSTTLSQEEEQITNQFLAEINRIRAEKRQPPISWMNAVKFLMARKFELKRAIDLFRAHEAIRIREKLDSFDPSQYHLRKELLTGKFTILPERDGNGAAVALFTARLHQPLFADHQTTLQGVVFQLDAAVESEETQRNGLVFVYDMTGSKFGNFDYDLSEKILNMLKGAYPARLKKVLIVTAPLWFKAPFKLLRLFIKEKLRDRVYTVNLQELDQHLSSDSRPRQLGGKYDLNHRAWLEHCLQTNGFKDTVNIDSFFRTLNKVETRDSPNQKNMNGPLSVMCSKDAAANSELDSENLRDSADEKHVRETREKKPLSNNCQDKMEDYSKEKRTHPLTQSKTPDFSPPTQRKRMSQHADVDLSPPPLPEKKCPTSPSSPVEDSIHMPEDSGMKIEEFVEHVKRKGKNGLFQEYAHIKYEAPCGTFRVSKSKCNLPKNRYTDVLAFDHSRVKLTPQNIDPMSDYINANYVDGYKHNNAFISTQGPLPTTFGDFWRMVWEQTVLVVVMTTRATERNRVKCGQYWPVEEESCHQHAEYVIRNRGIERNRDYIVTSLLLTNTVTDEDREITHFQFVSWPDYGIPHTAVGFLDFLFRVRAHQAASLQEITEQWSGHPLGPPILVHCSAGIGRTGTFITMDICTKRLADIGTIDVETTVRRIRSQRAFSIQMPDQFVFCHLALIEHAQREGILGEVDLARFDDSESESD